MSSPKSVTDASDASKIHRLSYKSKSTVRFVNNGKQQVTARLIRAWFERWTYTSYSVNRNFMKSQVINGHYLLFLHVSPPFVSMVQDRNIIICLNTLSYLLLRKKNANNHKKCHIIVDEMSRLTEARIHREVNSFFDSFETVSDRQQIISTDSCHILQSQRWMDANWTWIAENLSKQIFVESLQCIYCSCGDNNIIIHFCVAQWNQLNCTVKQNYHFQMYNKTSCWCMAASLSRRLDLFYLFSKQGSPLSPRHRDRNTYNLISISKHP